MHSRGNLQTVYNSCRRHLLDPNDAINRYQIDLKRVSRQRYQTADTGSDNLKRPVHVQVSFPLMLPIHLYAPCQSRPYRGIKPIGNDVSTSVERDGGRSNKLVGVAIQPSFRRAVSETMPFPALGTQCALRALRPVDRQFIGTHS